MIPSQPRPDRRPDPQLIAESEPYIVFTAAADGATTYFNMRGTEYTGLPAETNYGWNWLTLVQSDDAEHAPSGPGSTLRSPGRTSTASTASAATTAPFAGTPRAVPLRNEDRHVH